MVAFLAALVKILPALVWILSLVGGINTWNSASTVVVYGSTPDQTSILAAVVPLVFAGLTQFGTSWIKSYLTSLTGKTQAGAAAEILSILAVYQLAGDDADRRKTVNTFAHQWVDKELPASVTPSTK